LTTSIFKSWCVIKFAWSEFFVLKLVDIDSTAGKVSDKTKDQTDMMKLMTDIQKKTIRHNQLKNEKFRPRKFDNTPRFNYGRGQAYGQNYGRGHGYQIPCQQYCLL
jgi:hypothetical protein